MDMTACCLNYVSLQALRAQSVFFDERALQFFDSKHSEWEDRFLLLGWSQQARLLMVCHCLREEESIIRIISARPATRREARHYPGGKR